MNSYKVLNKAEFHYKEYAIIPIRYEDRFAIMKWRNEQMYHLRQNSLLSVEDQERYFKEVIANLFDQNTPDQLLFSYMKDGQCIGYGGLVHINWTDKNAEISFIMDTSLEQVEFNFHWNTYLGLITELAFTELFLHKIYTYAFDLRPHLYESLESCGFERESVLREHCYFEHQFKDVVIHSKINKLNLREANKDDVLKTYEWVQSKIVRKFSFSNDEVLFESHQSWFYSKLSSEGTYYFILQNSINQQLGSIRVDQNDSGDWIISYLIDPKFHGQGLGTLILKMLEQELSKYPDRFSGKTLLGMVLEENVASLHIFRKLKYSEEKKGNTYIFSRHL